MSSEVSATAPPDDADLPPIAPTPDDKSGMSSGTRALVDWIVVVVVALLVAFLVRTFVLAHFVVEGSSMHSTLETGDRVFVNKLSYRLHDPNRGDVVVLHEVTGATDRDLIKRVIALPGETWEMRDGATYVNGRKLDEPYVNQADLDTRSFGPQTVPDGMLFVMGDNRNHSGDSRFPPPSGLGYIPIDRVIGQAFVIIWPPSRAGWLH